MLQRKNKKEGRLWQGVLLNRMISNGSSEEEMVEYKMALNNRKTLKMWGNNVPGKKSKGPKSIAYIFILPGNGALKCSREGIWLPLLCYCDCVPAEASSASHRKARSCLPWNRDQQWSWEFSHSTHAHQDHCSKGLLLFREVLCGTGASVCLKVGCWVSCSAEWSSAQLLLEPYF